MVLRKEQIPVYSDLIMQQWDVPVGQPMQALGYNEKGETIVAGIKMTNVYNNHGKIVTEREYKTTINENQLYFGIKSEYMGLINNFRENKGDQFIGGMPVQLEKDCVTQLLRGTSYQKLIYGITLKVNGVRHLMFLSKSGIIYFIDRVTNFFYFIRENQEIVALKPTEFVFLFDGELVFHEQTQRWEFLIFDVLFYEYRGKIMNWMNNNYYDRLFILSKAVSELPIKDFDISVKTWIPIEAIKETNDIYQYVIDKTNQDRMLMRKPILKDDGLILQPFDGVYIPFREWNVYNNIQFKWKPPSQLTVDFKIHIPEDVSNEWWLMTKTNQNYNVKQKKGNPLKAIMIPTKSDKLKYKNGDVVECKLNEEVYERNVFIPITKREDKTEGNSLQTIMSTMNAIENAFTLDNLKPAILSILNNYSDPKKVLQFQSMSHLILCAVPMFFTNAEIKSIENIYNVFIGEESKNETIFQELEKQYTSFGSTTQYELEFRVFPYTSGGKESIKKFTYYYFLDFLRKMGFRHMYEFTIDLVLNEYTKDKTYRSTYTDLNFKNPINQVKTKIKSYKAIPTSDKQLYNNLTFKLALSTEKVSDIQVNLKNKMRNENVVYNTIRVKYRDSFYVGLWRIDITRVLTTMNIHKTGLETYEIECEYIGGKVPFQTFIDSMNFVYKLILGNTSYC